MVKLTIRGGDLDLVEYELQPFPPGKQMNTLGFEKKKFSLKPVKGTVHVKAPARIHLTVLDMNRFAPGKPGGGGVGFALQVYCTAEVTCIPKGVEIDYGRAPVLRHHAELFRKAVGYKGGFRIRARDHEYHHVGMGSTSTISIAALNAMNRAVGSPLTRDELRLLARRFASRSFVLAGIAYSFGFALAMILIAIWIFRTDRLLTGRFTKGATGSKAKKGIWRFVNLPSR